MKYTSIYLVLAMILSLGVKLNAQSPTPLKKGDLVPNFIEVDDKRNEINLESYKGKVVLLNFTATWCGPCWEIYEPMDDLQKQYKDDLVIISFHMDEMKEKWNKKAKSKGLKFDVVSIWDSETKQEIFKSFAPELYPHFVLLNSDGIIQKQWSGNLEKLLRKNVKRAMK